MADKMTSINPQMLVWARTMSGTSVREASEKFGKERLEAWENGADYPTYTQLKDLCNFYHKPVAVCFFPEPPQMKSLLTSCRTLPIEMYNYFSRELYKIIDEARVMQINLSELNNGTNSARSKISDIQLGDMDIHAAASFFRDILEAPLGEQKSIQKMDSAFEYWREKLAAIGVYVFKGAFKDNSISGLCLYDQEFPVIYINNSFSFTRQIFTLFHESYHLLAQTSGIDIFDDTELNKYVIGDNKTIEQSCNRFAGVFLVPDDDFDVAIKRKPPTEKFVSELALQYSVSREVILRKFLDRKIISTLEYQQRSADYTADYMRIKVAGTSKRSGDYYNTQASYKGKQYLQLAFGKYYSNQISIAQLARYLNMKIPSVQTLAVRKGWGAL